MLTMIVDLLSRLAEALDFGRYDARMGEAPLDDMLELRPWPSPTPRPRQDLRQAI